jgi:CheY-like chemotaxis protein
VKTFLRFVNLTAIILPVLQPLAIVFYERIMPGSQLVNRLQDLNYRVLTVSNPALLAAITLRESPLVLFVDLDARGDISGSIGRIKAEPACAHLPIVAFAPDSKPELLAAAQQAGAQLAVNESTLTGHLPQLLEQALRVD